MDARGFDRLAGVYALLERLAFGRDLEQARFAHLAELRSCHRILVLGEGDGRFLERLLREVPEARVDCVDASPVMVTRAEARLDRAARGRVQFHVADVLACELPEGPHDAVVTLFFLDCFTDRELSALVPRIAHRLERGALWSWADFAMPAGRFARLRARAWLRVLYGFFAWQTALSARRLPNAEEQIEAAGFRTRARTELRGGLLRSTVFADSRGTEERRAPEPSLGR